jgi:hypothetical protein
VKLDEEYRVKLSRRGVEGNSVGELIPGGNMVYGGVCGRKTETARLHCPDSLAFNSRAYSNAWQILATNFVNCRRQFKLPDEGKGENGRDWMAYTYNSLSCHLLRKSGEPILGMKVPRSGIARDSP